MQYSLSRFGQSEIFISTLKCLLIVFSMFYYAESSIYIQSVSLREGIKIQNPQRTAHFEG